MNDEEREGMKRVLRYQIKLCEIMLEEMEEEDIERRKQAEDCAIILFHALSKALDHIEFTLCPSEKNQWH